MAFFSKQVYSVDYQTPDSAPTATAMVCGEKTLDGIISLSQNAIPGNCTAQIGNEIDSILTHALRAGSKKEEIPVV